MVCIFCLNKASENIENLAFKAQKKKKKILSMNVLGHPHPLKVSAHCW